MGVRVTRAKLSAFALSGFLAGVAGVCFALVTQRFQASTFDPSQSILVVAMVIIGGLGSIEGAVLGALYLIGIPAIFGSTTTVQFVTSGVGLTIFILFLPGGLARLLHRAGDTLARVRLASLTDASWWTAAPGSAPIGMSELAEQMRVSIATMSQVVSDLESWELVERATDPTDRRRTLVSIAPKHRAAIRTIHEQRLRPLDRALRRLEPDERRTLIRGLDVLREELERTDASAAKESAR